MGCIEANYTQNHSEGRAYYCICLALKYSTVYFDHKKFH